MFGTPSSGSFVIQVAAVKYGPASKPGVDTGIGSASRPLPSPRRSSPVSTTSWHGASSTRRTGTGFAIA